ADASENGKGVRPNILMIMTFTGRPSSSANAGPVKRVATRTLAPASKHLVVDRAVSMIFWPCMESPSSGADTYVAGWLRRESTVAKHFPCRNHQATALRAAGRYPATHRSIAIVRL